MWTEQCAKGISTRRNPASVRRTRQERLTSDDHQAISRLQLAHGAGNHHLTLQRLVAGALYVLCRFLDYIHGNEIDRRYNECLLVREVRHIPRDDRPDVVFPRTVVLDRVFEVFVRLG